MGVRVSLVAVKSELGQMKLFLTLNYVVLLRMCPKDAERIANAADLDQTDYSYRVFLIKVYIVCQKMSIPVLRVISGTVLCCV